MVAGCVALVGMIKLNCGAVLAIPLIAEALAAMRSGTIGTGDATGCVSKRDKVALLLVVGTGAIVAAMILLLTVMAGTGWNALAWGLVGQRQRFTTDFYHTIPFSRFGILFATVSLLLLAPKFRVHRVRIAWARGYCICRAPPCSLSVIIGVRSHTGLSHEVQPLGLSSLVQPWFHGCGCNNVSESSAPWFLFWA